MKNSLNVAEPVINFIVAFVLVLACVSGLSALMWYRTAQELADLKLVNASYCERIQKLNEEIDIKRHKIDQANRMLALAYPHATMDFLSED